MISRENFSSLESDACDFLMVNHEPLKLEADPELDEALGGVQCAILGLLVVVDGVVQRLLLVAGEGLAQGHHSEIHS